jgi:hypothetical protein
MTVVNNFEINEVPEKSEAAIFMTAGELMKISTATHILVEEKFSTFYLLIYFFLHFIKN